jgi:MFS transporter, DHA1 family, multidrug resistance protein
VKSTRLALIVAALAALGPFSVDTYFPSFPDIAAHFNVSELQVQSTLSLYLVTLAAMNLFHGALSDSFGRQRVIVWSLAVYTATALACVVAPNFAWLLTMRVVQGLAAGAGMIVGRAVVRDVCEGAEAQKRMAQITMASGVGPVIAPILGGWLHVWFGWRGPFAFLGLLGGALWVSCRWGLPESLPAHLRQPLHPGRLLKAYTEAICHPEFLLLCLALALGGGGFLLYVATAPDVVVNILQLSSTQFGWLFLPIVSGMILGSAFSSKASGRIPARTMVVGGYALMGAGALLNLAASAWIVPRVPWSVLPLSVYTFGFALIAPVATVQGLDLLPTRKGLASSLQGFAHVLVFALISALVAPLVYRSAMNHALGLMLLMIASAVAYALSR